MRVNPLKLIVFLPILLFSAPSNAEVEWRSFISPADGFLDHFHAQAWIKDKAIRLQGRLPDTSERYKLLKLIHREATQADLSPELVLALIEVESGFEQYALSEAGARGLMQVMPFWKKHIGEPQDNLFDVETNLRYGCTILRHYLNIEKGNLKMALSRYNGSYGQDWYPARVFKKLNLNWR